MKNSRISPSEIENIRKQNNTSEILSKSIQDHQRIIKLNRNNIGIMKSKPSIHEPSLKNDVSIASLSKISNNSFSKLSLNKLKRSPREKKTKKAFDYRVCPSYTGRTFDPSDKLENYVDSTINEVLRYKHELSPLKLPETERWTHIPTINDFYDNVVKIYSRKIKFVGKREYKNIKSRYKECALKYRWPPYNPIYEKNQESNQKEVPLESSEENHQKIEQSDGRKSILSSKLRKSNESNYIPSFKAKDLFSSPARASIKQRKSKGTNHDDDDYEGLIEDWYPENFDHKTGEPVPLSTKVGNIGNKGAFVFTKSRNTEVYSEINRGAKTENQERKSETKFPLIKSVDKF